MAFIFYSETEIMKGTSETEIIKGNYELACEIQKTFMPSGRKEKRGSGACAGQKRRMSTRMVPLRPRGQASPSRGGAAVVVRTVALQVGVLSTVVVVSSPVFLQYACRLSRISSAISSCRTWRSNPSSWRAIPSRIFKLHDHRHGYIYICRGVYSYRERLGDY